MSAAEEGFRRLNWPHRGVRWVFLSAAKNLCIKNEIHRFFARAWTASCLSHAASGTQLGCSGHRRWRSPE